MREGDLAVLVECDGNGFLWAEIELEVGWQTHSGLGLAVLARFIPDDDGDFRARRVAEGVAVFVVLCVLWLVQLEHVAAVWHTNVADIVILVSVIFGRGNASKGDFTAAGRGRLTLGRALGWLLGALALRLRGGGRGGAGGRGCSRFSHRYSSGGGCRGLGR